MRSFSVARPSRFLPAPLLLRNAPKVIVVSENLGLLSSAVLALAALTRPLLWVHPLVPVMPMDMAEMLSAPVPYLIGGR